MRKVEQKLLDDWNKQTKKMVEMFNSIGMPMEEQIEIIKGTLKDYIKKFRKLSEKNDKQ